MSGRTAWTLPVVATIGGGLAGLVTAVGGWTAGTVERDVGGLAVPESLTAPGTEFAPALLPLALVALLAGVVLAVLRGAPRRWLGVLTAALGAGMVAAAAAGALAAGGADGTVTAVPAVAALAGLAVLAGGVVAFTGPTRPPARTPYTVDAAEKTVDDEWALADADDQPGEEGAAGAPP